MPIGISQQLLSKIDKISISEFIMQILLNVQFSLNFLRVEQKTYRSQIFDSNLFSYAESLPSSKRRLTADDMLSDSIDLSILQCSTVRVLRPENQYSK